MIVSLHCSLYSDYYFENIYLTLLYNKCCRRSDICTTQNKNKMFKKDIKYERSVCDGVAGLTGSLLDIFAMPLVLQHSWNYVMPHVFDVKEITYVYALLFKIILLVFINSPFSGSHELYIWYETLCHYSNSLHAKLTDIETSIDTYVKARTNQRHNVYAMNAPFDMV